MAEQTSVAQKFEALRPVLNELARRRWAATEALAFGHGGISAVARATGLSHKTIRTGIRTWGKAIPDGVYDLHANVGWVSVGVDHDPPAFAVATIRAWWLQLGAAMYPRAQELLITAGSGGSNSARARLWKRELPRFGAESGLHVSVSHLPPGTSKWNKIAHRLFCHITANWRGKPLQSREVVVSLIGATTTTKGLRIQAALDAGQYPTGVNVSEAEMTSLQIEGAAAGGTS
jgi:Rhodopirellula transposase DDE domain